MTAGRKGWVWGVRICRHVGAGPSLDEVSHPADTPPVDAEVAYPDVVSETSAPQPILVEQLDDFEEPELPEPSLFDPASTEHGSYRLPDASVLRRSRIDKNAHPEKAI